MSLEKTGYCWECGMPCKDLFCDKKCEERYRRKQGRQIRRGRRAGYGVAGSTH